MLMNIVNDTKKQLRHNNVRVYNNPNNVPNSNIRIRQQQ